MDIVKQVQAMSYVADEAANEIEWLRGELRTAADEIERLREALREMVNEKCEYMHINHLGDPETTHTIKLAHKALKGKE